MAAFLLPSLSSFPDKTVLLRFRELYSSYQACFSVVSRMRRRKGPQQTKNQGQGSRAGILRRLEEKRCVNRSLERRVEKNQEDTPVDIILGFYVCPTSTFLECPIRIWEWYLLGGCIFYKAMILARELGSTSSRQSASKLLWIIWQRCLNNTASTLVSIIPIHYFNNPEPFHLVANPFSWSTAIQEMCSYFNDQKKGRDKSRFY